MYMTYEQRLINLFWFIKDLIKRLKYKEANLCIGYESKAEYT